MPMMATLIVPSGLGIAAIAAGGLMWFNLRLNF